MAVAAGAGTVGGSAGVVVGAGVGAVGVGAGGVAAGSDMVPRMCLFPRAAVHTPLGCEPHLGSPERGTVSGAAANQGERRESKCGCV